MNGSFDHAPWTRSPSQHRARPHDPTKEIAMKQHTVILPFLLPRLSDTAAAQLVAILQTLFTIIEHHYADQVNRQRRREDNRQVAHSPRYPTDDPF